MEERIAELNRQSMEARGKLLQLIEQQKLVGLNPSSPPVSPIQSPLRAWTGWSQIHDLKGRQFKNQKVFTFLILQVYIGLKEISQSIYCSAFNFT